MNEFLTFRKMITPMIIQILFWIFAAITVITGLVAVVAGEDMNNRLGGIIMIFVGPIMVRIYCEILIVIFRINDSLREIEKNTKPKELPQQQAS